MSLLPDAARLKSSPDTAVLFAASERWRCPIFAVKRLGYWTWGRPPGPQRRAVRYSDIGHPPWPLMVRMGFQGESKRSAAADLCGISTLKFRISGGVGFEVHILGVRGRVSGSESWEITLVWGRRG